MKSAVKELTFVIVLDLLLLQNAASSVCRVLVQPPWPQSTLVPLQSSNVELECVRSEPGHLFLWSRVENRDENLIQADDETLGIYLSDIEENSLSQFLTINKTSVNNNITFTCTSRATVQETKVIIYQPNLTISESNIGLQTVSMSWSKLSDEYYQPMENYTLIVQNINESSYQTFSLNESFYVFTSKEDNSSCAVFNFSVFTSFTTSIHSGSCVSESNAVQTMLPSLPNITLLESSINISLSRGEGRFILSVSFLPSSTCSKKYRVTSYMLEVTGEIGIVNLNDTDNPTSQITISYNELEENSKYSFRIVTFNVVGNISTSNKEFFTTDVQNVTATVLENENAFVIQCDFITGSNAQGCMVVLVGEFDNITANLTRNKSKLNVNVTQQQCYDKVFGFDIESDGSVGTLAVPGVIIRNMTGTCASMRNISADLTRIIVAIIILVMVLTSIIVIFIVICIAVRCYKVRRSSPKHSDISYGNQGQENIQDSMSGPVYADLVKTRTPGDGDDAADHHYNTTSHVGYEEKEDVNSSNNNNYSELNEDSTTEHHYFVLENNGGRPQKKSEDINITPDPDAPALPPPFKPDPPPVYQDINGMPYMQEDTAENEYATVKK